MSLLASVSASKALKASRALAGGKSIACRYMSVIKLDGEEEVSKFRMTNSKSILYFTATWCPPCKMIKPVYEKLSKANSNVAFGLVDIDENSEAAMDFEINAVPTFVFFDGEKAVEKMTGADVQQLEKLVADLNVK